VKIQRNLKTKLYLLFLLSAFNCLAQENKIEEKRIEFISDNLNFSGTLFVPPGDINFPAVVILHGGSSNVKAHRSTSDYYGYRFAKRGIAALIYDKRGTGDSGGEVSKSIFDDYVVDAINAIQFLKKQAKINPHQIGIIGPSQGGRIAALAAARSSDVAFIATLSAPLVSVADLMYFSTMSFIEIDDSTKIIVDPLWKKHFKCVEHGDVQGLKNLDFEIDYYAKTIKTQFLPPKSENLKAFDKGDFQPMYNSMKNDYLSELSKVKIPWLNIYAEYDRAVPVEASIEVMKTQMAIGGNKDYEIKIIPDVGHGFKNIETKEYFRVEDIAIDWILNKL